MSPKDDMLLLIGLKNTFIMTPWEFAEFCKKENLKFDIVTIFEVSEHQDKSTEFLEAVKSMLKPGGRVAGSVLNGDRRSWEITRRFFYEKPSSPSLSKIFKYSPK